MMDRSVAFCFMIPFDQRKIGNPNEIEFVRIDQPQLVA